MERSTGRSSGMVRRHDITAERGAELVQTSSRKKYLGDAEDPHFVPNSPIITRQRLTYEQEEELTRSCTLVLSNIQHEDDEDEDPLLQYISKQLENKQMRTAPRVQKEKSEVHRSNAGTTNEHLAKAQKPRHFVDDTATPSEKSKRDTMDRTDTSTPLTVLSDTMRRSSSSQQKVLPRPESKTLKPQSIYQPHDKPRLSTRPKESGAVTKSMTSLPTAYHASDRETVTAASKRTPAADVPRAEFNKSLPLLPQFGTPVPEKQSSSISWLFRSSKKKSAPPLTSSDPPVPTSVPRIETGTSSGTTRKSRFSFSSLFGRKKQQSVQTFAR